MWAATREERTGRDGTEDGTVRRTVWRWWRGAGARRSRATCAAHSPCCSARTPRAATSPRPSCTRNATHQSRMTNPNPQPQPRPTLKYCIYTHIDTRIISLERTECEVPDALAGRRGRERVGEVEAVALVREVDAVGHAVAHLLLVHAAQAQRAGRAVAGHVLQRTRACSAYT